jgi:uncharacterized membrane protein HdeD (DUF308 family)
MATTELGLDDRTAAFEALRHRWGWLLALGLVQIAVGLFAIGAPVVASLASALFVGWVLLFSGAVQLLHAFQVRGWKGFLLHLVGALLYLAAGVVIVLFPLGGVLTLTLFLAGVFLVEGVSRTMLALRMRPAQGWGWFLVGGLAGIVLGLMIWLEWPSSALWALGLLVGINLLFSGVSLTSLALAFRRAHP